MYCAPSKFKVEPYGTVVQQVLDSEGDVVKVLLWVQASKDLTAINWMTTEKLMSIALDPKFATDHVFKEMVLEAYEKNKPLT